MASSRHSCGSGLHPPPTTIPVRFFWASQRGHTNPASVDCWISGNDAAQTPQIEPVQYALTEDFTPALFHNSTTWTPIISCPATFPIPYPHRGTRHITTLLPSLCITPLPNTPTDPNSCSYRIYQGLLETLHQYRWGVMANYLQEVGPLQLFSLTG